MPRYFIEVGYMGTNYAGFQKQNNANSIQSEVEKALSTFFRTDYSLTGSSRTDSGVHAKQNFFHFDCELLLGQENFTKVIYHINAILPLDIVVQSIKEVNHDSHCRFDALSRTYEYIVYQNKNPFLKDRAYYYPYSLDINLLQQLAGEIMNHTDFESFAKRNTQVHTFFCTIFKSEWIIKENYMIFRITANRFLRGMVKGLVGTMLRLASKNDSIIQFRSIILSKNPSRVDFSVPSHGLTLQHVNLKLQ